MNFLYAKARAIKSKIARDGERAETDPVTSESQNGSNGEEENQDPGASTPPKTPPLAPDISRPNSRLGVKLSRIEEEESTEST